MYLACPKCKRNSLLGDKTAHTFSCEYRTTCKFRQNFAESERDIYAEQRQYEYYMNRYRMLTSHKEVNDQEVLDLLKAAEDLSEVSAKVVGDIIVARNLDKEHLGVMLDRLNGKLAYLLRRMSGQFYS